MIANTFLNKINKNIPDKLYLTLKYFFKTGKFINWKNPKGYCEKLQWLKLYNRDNNYSELVDKFLVKNYVEKKIGKKYIIPTLGVWDNFDDIEFDKLPNKFVLKCTHDSGGIVICKNKELFDKNKAKIIIETSLKNNYYYGGREWPYFNIKPRILCETYMEDINDKELRDYKFFVFNGKPTMMFIATDRFDEKEETCFDFYDMDFNHLDIKNGHPNSSKIIKKPEKFEEMKEMAKILGENFPHVRVDFYQVNGEIYFGELTFFHHSGFVLFEPYEWELKMGDLINLPK